MSINRDESARESAAREGVDSCLVSSFALAKALDGVSPGVYLGPKEDIKLLLSELGLDDPDASRVSDVPTWVVGTMLGSALVYGYKAYIATHAGYRDGVPLFDFKRVLSYDDRRWWVIPKWIAIRLRLPEASFRDGFEYDLQSRV